MYLKSGQILILVLLIVVVALAVGLSVASRNITNLRTATQTDQSQRAFTAAEGGVENVLSNLGSYASNPNITTGIAANVPVGDLSANVNVQGFTIYESTIDLGNVAQIDLAGVNSGSVQIDWARGSAETTGDGPASIEVAQFYGNPLNQERWYLQGQPGTRGGNEVINSNPSGFSLGCSPASGFAKCVLIDAKANAKILRIKPFFASTTVRVSGPNLPVQTYDIISEVHTQAGITRKVQVSRTALPQLPAIFDYVLYSEGNIIK